MLCLRERAVSGRRTVDWEGLDERAMADMEVEGGLSHGAGWVRRDETGLVDEPVEEAREGQGNG